MGKKKLIIILIIVLIIVVGCVAVVKLSPPGFTDVISAKGEDNLTTQLGDKFLLKYETRNFPDYETVVTILDVSNKNIMGHYLAKYDYKKPNYSVHINLKDLRCYEIGSSLIYKVNNGQFKGVAIGSIKQEKVEGNNDLIIVSKALIEKKEWVWIYYCGELLLKAGDEDVRKTLNRYAAGKFTEDELNLNKNSIYNKNDMQTFAKQVIEHK